MRYTWVYRDSQIYLRFRLGVRHRPRIIKNQMEKITEPEVETGMSWRLKVLGLDRHFTGH